MPNGRTNRTRGISTAILITYRLTLGNRIDTWVAASAAFANAPSHHEYR